MMTFFDDPGEAKRYSESRPYFHPIAIERGKEAMGIESRLPLGVDIACGSGQSTAALTAIAERVIGFDISRNMLLTAVKNERTHYVQARAEAIPLRNGLLPIMSCALAFHWFDRDQFFAEARRVLRDEGWLFIYTNGFIGVMRGNPSFSPWGQKVYGKRFPTPPRDNRPLTEKVAQERGFELMKEESYENEINFTPQELVAYLTTQTNVVAALKQGRETLASAHKWLLDQVRPFYTDKKATFVFRTRAWYLKKQAPPY